MNPLQTDRPFAIEDLARDGLVRLAAGLFIVIGVLWALGCVAVPPDPNSESGDSGEPNGSGDPTISDDGLSLTLPGGVTMEFVKIPAGSFEMGTNWGTDDSWLRTARPVHTVTFAQPFYMGKYEVTQAQWDSLMLWNPSAFSGPNRPVDRISWYWAKDFCRELSTHAGRTARLPSEAEWEYACKAGSGDTKWHFGDDPSQLVDYAWYNQNSNNETHDVGGKLPNAWGLHDMLGNVMEWCLDFWNDDYEGAPDNGAAWTPWNPWFDRVVRGGCWGKGDNYCRSAYRYRRWPTRAVGSYNGFRVVLPEN